MSLPRSFPKEEKPVPNPTIDISVRTLADVVCLAEGVFAPLDGFMRRDDYESVLRDMRTASGAIWSLPVCLPVTDDEVAALRGHATASLVHDRRHVADVSVGDVYDYDKESEAKHAFGTTEDAHPGVAALARQSERYLSGTVE